MILKVLFCHKGNIKYTVCAALKKKKVKLDPLPFTKKSIIGKELLVISGKQHLEIPDLDYRQGLSVYYILVRSVGNLSKYLANTQTRIKTPPPSNFVGWRQAGALIRQTVLQVTGSS